MDDTLTPPSHDVELLRSRRTYFRARLAWGEGLGCRLNKTHLPGQLCRSKQCINRTQRVPRVPYPFIDSSCPLGDHPQAKLRITYRAGYHGQAQSIIQYFFNPIVNFRQILLDIILGLSHQTHSCVTSPITVQPKNLPEIFFFQKIRILNSSP